MRVIPRRPVISAVTNRRLLSDRDDEACDRLVEWSAAVAKADVDILQIRERGLEAATLARLVRDVLAASAGSRMRVVVNDRIDIALAVSAAGVHLPSAAPSAAVVRRIVSDGFLIGRSVHATDDLAQIERTGGCDYLTFGTVFLSAGKPEGHAVAGVEALGRACAATTLPVLAIGGMTVPLAAEAARAGAAGIAAIGLFLDPWRGPGGPADRAARLADTVAALRAAFSAASRRPEPRRTS
jgi:thiamine-phosphate pyrophosphorylase